MSGTVVLVDYNTGLPLNPVPVTRSLDHVSVHQAIVTASGNTAIWDPAAGKRFVLVGVYYQYPATLTTAGGSLLSLYDGTTTNVLILSDAQATNPATHQHIPIGRDGYLSAAADNILYANLSAAVTAGSVTVSVWGYEI
jgi:hypothetical protein